MKKIDYKLGIILTLIGLSVFQYFNPTIKEVEIVKEVEVTKTIIDSVYVDKIVEKKIYYPKYITKIEKDTVETDLAKVLNLNPIYFDFDKSNIRDDARIELNKVSGAAAPVAQLIQQPGANGS